MKALRLVCAATPHLIQLGSLGPAAVHHGWTTSVKATATRWIERGRHVSVESHTLLLSSWIRQWDRREQGARVRVRRFGEQLVGIGEFDDLAEIHHGDAIRDVLHHGEIVGDEQIRKRELLSQVNQQVQHLRANRHVERRDRFVAHDELGVECNGASNTDALSLTTREFVRIAIDQRLADAHLFEQLTHARLELAALEDSVNQEGLADDVSDAHTRIQRAEWILKDDLHVAAHASKLRPF